QEARPGRRQVHSQRMGGGLSTCGRDDHLMLAAAAGVGWFLAIGIGVLSLGLRRRLAEQMEVAARASHELRGSITAARLGLRPGAPSPARLRALELELGRATLAVEDLVGSCARRAAGRELELLDPAQ